MGSEDVVAEAPFCVACRRSSAVKWRKHVFSRGHQQAAQEFLLRHAAKLQELCDAATTGASDASWWRCVFCDVALATADALTHFGSDGHKAQVKAFCCHHRCDADHQARPQLWLQAAKRRELEAALSNSQAAEDRAQQADEQEQKQEPVNQATSERVEAFLSSAASRLQEVHMERRRAVEDSNEVGPVTREHQQEVMLGPQLALATAPSRCKTVSSDEGVLQNPLGRHEGKRVWGGGIVKLRKAEWIPWAIDQLVKEEQADHPETQHDGKDGLAFVHRVTELARGEGLSSIASVTWGASVANVHTAAVPPWMVQTEEEYKKCNRREQAAPLPSLPTRTGKNIGEATTDKRRDIFSELHSMSEYDPGWLPNFGGVWQEGPRSKTKKAFRKATGLAKPSRDQTAPRPTELKTPRVPLQVASQSAPLAKSLSPPLSSTQPPVPTVGQQHSGDHVPNPAALPTKPQREAPVLSPQEPSKDNCKTTNPLDAKKQMLLAQKERLRAKMAARRRK
ncbi:hypothetical protein PF005_g14670 [Phytophthora fragariae]|nr:hypothetical protein PF011_g6705 [Phytophthora fragariae]KAE9120357.1 hypothetical protein PF007_g8204 [Phytophthora fragariae]KAE9120678.1 hypothetical protein PF010_g7406 [Phytophthora fragariae]KAE9202170.1 hypothetical protein PF005_g14670 [Phytophthora fragariae]KAE9256845.1 hypothetical protein PF002_g1598 [Phytophthora fragariae]